MAIHIISKFFFFLVLGFAVGSSVIQRRDKEWKSLLDDMMRKDMELDQSSTRKASENLLITLVSSLLYIYLILTVYYLMLLDTQDPFARVISCFAKFMIVLTSMVHLTTKYLLPRREMFGMINRLTICLFILSILHLGACLYLNYFTFPNIPEIIRKYWRKFRALLEKKTPQPPQIELELQDTPV
ncbi:uncharacterized protein LOC103312976 isoform X2 [Tribolium castaneum]|uniref:uncharacterized protein LOC103312976 isoform X2 n=1 Tax=Tribolium castaneum TaxID=7070 RepID=UPI0001DCBFBD